MDGTIQGKLIELTEVAYKNKEGSYWKMIIENGDRKNTINSDKKPELQIGERGSFNYKENSYTGADGKEYKSKWLQASFSPQQPTQGTIPNEQLDRIEQKIDRLIQYVGPEGMV